MVIAGGARGVDSQAEAWARSCWPAARRRGGGRKVGRLIHASNTGSVALGGIRGDERPAALLTGVSAVNTVLAFLGSRE